MLELRCGGQDVVGVIGGIGLKMLKHHGEQIFSRKTFNDMTGLRRYRNWVAVVDHQGLNVWTECL